MFKRSFVIKVDEDLLFISDVLSPLIFVRCLAWETEAKTCYFLAATTALEVQMLVCLCVTLAPTVLEF